MEKDKDIKEASAGTLPHDTGSAICSGSGDARSAGSADCLSGGEEASPGSAMEKVRTVSCDNQSKESKSGAAEEHSGETPKDDAGALSPDCSGKKKNKKKKKPVSPIRKGFLGGLALGMAIVIAADALIILHPFDREGLDLAAISSKMHTIENLIDRLYLYDADKQLMEDSIFTGMMYSLTEDKYAEYYSEESFREETKVLNGSYVGIGVTITEDSDGRGIRVISVNVDGPAAEAGIQEEDIITGVDGVSLVGASSQDAVDAITGEEGTEITVRLLRDGEELELTVKRKKIVNVSVHYEVLSEEDMGRKNVRVKGTELGYLSITAFNQATLPDYQDAITDLIEDCEVAGLIIDLRNNGGGDLDICIEMLDRIIYDKAGIDPEKYVDDDYAAQRAEDTIDNAILLTVEGRDPEDCIRYYAGDGLSVSIPIVVVVNSQSASASEVFTGGLRDYGCEVVGEKTYGKGIVQSLYTLDDGSAVKFTTDQYRLPAGELIHGVGIEPTIEVEFEDYANETSSTVNYADGSAQDLMGDAQIAAAVTELNRQIYEAYQGE